jgi:hypothetical protein
MHVVDLVGQHPPSSTRGYSSNNLAPSGTNINLAKNESGGVVINGGCRIPNPANSRLFQLRSEEGRDYKECVQ